MTVIFKISQEKRKAVHDFSLAAHIITLVCRRMQVTPAQLESWDRHWVIVWPRWLAIYLVRRHTGMSSGRIGAMFNRDHAAILHACKGTEAQLQGNRGARADYAWLNTEIVHSIEQKGNRKDPYGI